MAMLGYEQLSSEEKVRRAVRVAWFEMPQVWVDALRQMPSEVKLTRSTEMWVIMRDSLYRKASRFFRRQAGRVGCGGNEPADRMMLYTNPEASAWFLSPEDVILYKLNYYR